MMEKEQVAPMKQVIWYALINYLGTALGVISALLIYPKDFEFQGMVKYVDAISQVFAPLMVFGASQALIKFYPALTEHHRRQLFNYSMVSIVAISLLIFCGTLLFTTVLSIDYAHTRLIYFAFPIAISLAFIELFKKQSQDLQKIAVPTLYEKLIPKIVLPAAFLLTIYKIFSENASLYVYTLGYVLIFILTAIYLFSHYRPVFNYRFKALFKEISAKDYYRYSAFSFAGSLGSFLAFRIDSLIIPDMLSMQANGIFSNGVALATVIQIPALGMFALYAPIVSNLLKAENYTDLNIKYKEIARLLFFIGAILYSCIFLGMEDLFRLMPDYNKLKETLPIINILGFSVLINMATGFNSEIITYSKYYRFNLVAVLVLMVINVSLNLYFISLGLGLVGVAFSSFVSMTTFNVIKLVFIYRKFRLLPFDKKFLQMGAIFAVTGVAVYFLPAAPSHFINLVYKCGLSLFVNAFVVYRLRLVYQVNIWANQAMAKLFK